MSWAKPGVPCICISRNPEWDWLPRIQTPRIGATYTVRELSADGEAILLCEITNPAKVKIIETDGTRWGEPDFAIHRFIPIEPEQAARSTHAEVVTA